MKRPPEAAQRNGEPGALRTGTATEPTVQRTRLRAGVAGRSVCRICIEGGGYRVARRLIAPSVSVAAPSLCLAESDAVVRIPPCP